MKAVIAVGVVALAMLCSPAAKAWNCSNSLAERVPVPTGTAGTYGDGDGQLFLGTANEGVAGQLYECEVVPPGTTPPAGSIITNTNSSNSNSSSSSQSKSNSNSSSSSTANGGNAVSTAIGGAGGQGGAGGSVKNSGNSTNTSTNTNVAQGGTGGNANQKQGQQQTQTANGGSATASGNGVGNGNNSDNTVVNYPRQTPSAIAPEVFPTVPCFKGTSVAGSGGAFSFGFGGGKIDENCAELEAARQAPTRVARCKVYLLNKYVQKAGVTLEDCLGPSVVPERAVERQQLVAPAPQIVVNVPAINVPAPIIIEQQIPVAPPLPVAPRPLPPAVKQHHPIKPCIQTTCPPAKLSSKVWTDEDVERLNPANQ